MARPQPGDYAPYAARYVDLVKGDNVQEIIGFHSEEIELFYNSLPAEKAGYFYAAGKWTLAQVVQHVIDTERIFAYRALRFARNDSQALQGFDENAYAAVDGTANRLFDQMLLEFNALRISTDILLLSFDDTMLLRSGTASGHRTTVLAMTSMLYGHLLHHKQILQERYL
jgi:hypothetical protein